MDQTNAEKKKISGVGFLWLDFLKQTLQRIRSQKVNYCLGFSACFIVVLVVSLLETIIGNAPVVLLRLAELQQGEIDLIAAPGNWTGKSALNFTLTESILTSHGETYSYSTPRYEDDVVATGSCQAGLNISDKTWIYGSESCDGDDTLENCFYSACNGKTYGGTLILLDSNREKAMNLGREWTLDKIPGVQTCYLQQNLADTLGIRVGDYIFLDFTGTGLFGNPSFYSDTQDRDDNLGDRVILPVKVVTLFSSPSGKFANSISNVILMEYENFFPTLVSALDPIVSQQRINELQSFNLYEYAESIAVNLPPPRISAYLTSNYDTLQKTVVEFAAEAVFFMGFNELDVQLPVLSYLNSTKFFGLFLGLILNIVTFILLFLSILLIYSLLMINVETRTFEMGVLRIIGITRAGIIQLLLFQAFSYSLPAWVAGLVISRIASIFIFKGFKSLTGIPISSQLTSDAILLATGLGILIPIVASFFPIRTALGKNLSDALDIKHSKTKAVKISINRSEAGSFSPVVLIIGTGMALFGFFVYFLVPLSLLSSNFALLLNLFFFLLLGMILGLVVLSLNIQNFLEKFLVKLFLFWEKGAITNLVLKNLIAHRVRNRKTTIMYALSLGFIIFVSVSFTLNVDSFVYSIQQSNGAYLKIIAPAGTNGTLDSYSINIKEELETTLLENPSVESFSWISAPLNDIIINVDSISINNVGNVFTFDQIVATTSPNLLSTTIGGFLSVDSRLESKELFTVIEDLYSVRGSYSMLLGSSFKDGIGIDLNSHFLYETTIFDSPFEFYDTRNLKSLAFLSASPAFTFSPFPSEVTQNALLSMTSYVRLSQTVVSSVDDIPMQYLLIKIGQGGDIDSVIKVLQQLILLQPALSIWDYRDAIRPINTANEVMSYFFNFTTVVAMLISFFSLMSSMYTNIYEQTKEIGILRAIGIHKWWMYRIYSYEAFILVFSASLMGVVIGFLVSWTMTVQRVLFTQLPIPFVFPYVLLVTVFVASIFFAVLASWSPTRSIVKLPVVQIMRILQ